MDASENADFLGLLAAALLPGDEAVGKDGWVIPAAQPEAPHPLVVLLDALLNEARRWGAETMSVRCGVSAAGVSFARGDEVRPIVEIPARLLPAFTARVKIVAWLDISERRKPQAGRIDPGREGCSALPACRVSVSPGPHGEDIRFEFR